MIHLRVIPRRTRRSTQRARQAPRSANPAPTTWGPPAAAARHIRNPALRAGCRQAPQAPLGPPARRTPVDEAGGVKPRPPSALPRARPAVSVAVQRSSCQQGLVLGPAPQGAIGDRGGSAAGECRGRERAKRRGPASSEPFHRCPPDSNRSCLHLIDPPSMAPLPVGRTNQPFSLSRAGSRGN